MKRRRAVTPKRTVRLGPLPGYIGYALKQAQGVVMASFHKTMQPVKLRPTQFAVLLIIRENPGVTPSAVCAALGVQKANFVPLLGELERRKLATRRAGGDRRSYALHLTTEGERLLARACALHQAHERALIERLGEQNRDQLLRLLRRLAQGGANLPHSGAMARKGAQDQ